MLRVSGVLAATILAAAVSGGCLEAPPTGAGPADAAAAALDAAMSFTVSRQPELPIPDEGGPVEDQLEVEPICTIGAITVDMHIVHVFRGDLAIRLTSPTVRTAILKQSAEEDDEDDVVGNYPTNLVPVDSLDIFAGLPARGLWTLSVEDVCAGSIGTLSGWALNLTCQ